MLPTAPVPAGVNDSLSLSCEPFTSRGLSLKRNTCIGKKERRILSAHCLSSLLIFVNCSYQPVTIEIGVDDSGYSISSVNLGK